MRVKQHKEEDARQVNQRYTVGICPVRNAAGQKPVAKLRADFLEYAAKVAAVEYGTPTTSPVIYLWSVDTEHEPWVGLTHDQLGQYPEESVIIAGRRNPDRGLV